MSRDEVLGRVDRVQRRPADRPHNDDRDQERDRRLPDQALNDTRA